MPAEIYLLQTADGVDLAEKRKQLEDARTKLLERESGLIQLRSKLKAFESRYFREVGVLYAELDEIEARIAEREVDLYDSEGARSRAKDARQRAKETHDAAFDDAQEAEEFDPPLSLKTLYREVAKRIHPDFARDEAEQRYLTVLMARANQAYRRGDVGTLQRLLDDQREVHSSEAEEGVHAELSRILRQIEHLARDIAALDAEERTLLAGEIAQLYQDAETSALQHRDLLAEMAANLREQVADALRRFEFVDRQIAAHGR